MQRPCIPSIFNIFDEDIHKSKFMSFNHTNHALNAQRDKVKHGSPKLKIKQGRKSHKSGYKKAIITLKKGQSIDLTTGV